MEDKMTKKLQWGILGTATIAKKSVIPGIRESNTGEIKAVASRTLEKAQEMAREAGAKEAYGSYEELLQDEEVDAVYIPLPNHLHKEWVIKAAKAGKHVLCEKPIALNESEAKEMQQTCVNHSVVLAEAFMYRYQARYAHIKRIIKSGGIGEIRGIRAVFSFNNSEDMSNFRMKRANGGGGLYDIGVYPLSLARMIYEEEPEAVTVHGFAPASHDHVDMVAAGLVEFSGGKFLTFDCGMWAAFRNEAEILGTDGRIFIPNAFTGGLEGYELITENGSETIEVKDVNHYALQADVFAQAIWKEKSLPFGADDAVANMKVLDACLTSQENRKRIELGGER